MRSTTELLRGAAALALFALFGAGALAISPLMLVLRRPDRAQPVIRTLWRLVARLFVGAGLIGIDRGNLTSVRGAVVVANHPTLIDVVLIVALVPRTLYVAKHALKGNPFLSAIVRATALPDDATLPDIAAPFLKAGWNVLIFPEGTRTPRDGKASLKRGAAQLAIRAQAPVVCVRETLTRRILAKGQHPWDMGDKRVTFSFRMSEPISPAAADSSSPHAAAVRLTDEIRAQICPGKNAEPNEEITRRRRLKSAR